MLFIVLIICSNSHGYEPSAGNMSTYFGPYLYKTNFDAPSTTNLKASHLAGVGLVVLGDINEKSSLEIGLFFTNKIYYREQAGSFISEQSPLAHITMGYRRWLSESISTSLTLYSDYSFGVPIVIHSDFASGNEIETSTRSKVVYGADLAVQFELFTKLNYAIVFDLRYSKALTSKSSESADVFSTLLGFRYLFQDKDKKSEL